MVDRGALRRRRNADLPQDPDAGFTCHHGRQIR
jgi:hypothetical protein